MLGDDRGPLVGAPGGWAGLCRCCCCSCAFTGMSAGGRAGACPASCSTLWSRAFYCWLSHWGRLSVVCGG